MTCFEQGQELFREYEVAQVVGLELGLDAILSELVRTGLCARMGDKGSALVRVGFFEPLNTHHQPSIADQDVQLLLLARDLARSIPHTLQIAQVHTDEMQVQLFARILLLELLDGLLTLFRGARGHVDFGSMQGQLLDCFEANAAISPCNEGCEAGEGGDVAGGEVIRRGHDDRVGLQEVEEEGVVLK